MSIPSTLMEGLDSYVNHRIKPGSFLLSVVSNDLSGSIRRADPESLQALPAIVSWLVENAPYVCWGSIEAVERWLGAGDAT